MIRQLLAPLLISCVMCACATPPPPPPAPVVVPPLPRETCELDARWRISFAVPDGYAVTKTEGACRLARAADVFVRVSLLAGEVANLEEWALLDGPLEQSRPLGAGRARVGTYMVPMFRVGGEVGGAPREAVVSTLTRRDRTLVVEAVGASADREELRELVAALAIP